MVAAMRSGEWIWCGQRGDDRGVSANDDLFAHYGKANEAERLFRSGHGRLELERTRQLLQRHLPLAPADVLDVGGGTGVHATWLARQGYHVQLVDLVPEHVRAANTDGTVIATVGDARSLPQATASIDAVLLLGPLYHLVTAEDRHLALIEARRVLRPAGILLAAAISRFMAILDWASHGALTEDVAEKLRPVLKTGVHDPNLGFTDAYFHTAAQLQQEVETAGFVAVRVVGIEGPAWTITDVEDDAGQKFRSALHCAQFTEDHSEITNASAHLMAVATTT